MVITPLSSHGIKAELPQTSAANAADQPEPEIVLEITKERQFLFNGQAVSHAKLKAEIVKLYRDRIGQQLFIRADRELEYSTVAMAMDEMRGANAAVQFGLLAKK